MIRQDGLPEIYECSIELWSKSMTFSATAKRKIRKNSGQGKSNPRWSPVFRYLIVQVYSFSSATVRVVDATNELSLDFAASNT